MKRVIADCIPTLNDSERTNFAHKQHKTLLTGNQLQLKQNGIALHKMMQRVDKNLSILPKHLQQDKKAKWIFDKSHRDVKNEFALTAMINKTLHHIVIDRTFIDKNDIRWIIDYKTTEHLVLENHRAQLEKYATIMRLQESREIYLGLYSLLTTDWIDWRFEK